MASLTQFGPKCTCGKLARQRQDVVLIQIKLIVTTFIFHDSKVKQIYLFPSAAKTNQHCRNSSTCERQPCSTAIMLTICSTALAPPCWVDDNDLNCTQFWTNMPPLHLRRGTRPPGLLLECALQDHHHHRRRRQQQQQHHKHSVLTFNNASSV